MGTSILEDLRYGRARERRTAETCSESALVDTSALIHEQESVIRLHLCIPMLGIERTTAIWNDCALDGGPPLLGVRGDVSTYTALTVT